jgi:leader peptidase (prepilin peptidase) / N-methyltransferase
MEFRDKSMFDVISFLYRPLDYPWACLPAVVCLGALIGSYLNVCIYRIPAGKSLWWPGSHCGNCYQPVRKLDNLPLLSYWVLQGRCRTCQVKYSARYFWIELLITLMFASTFIYFLTSLKYSSGSRFAFVGTDRLFYLWIYIVCFLSFLAVAYFIDIDHHQVPIRLTLPGTVVGLIGSILIGYLWQSRLTHSNFDQNDLTEFYRLPFWVPLLSPSTPIAGLLPTKPWHHGFLVSLAGAFSGMLIQWLVVLYFRNRKTEPIHVTEARFLILIGAFLGWQGLLSAVAYAVILFLSYSLVLQVIKNKRTQSLIPMLITGALLVLFDPFRLQFIFNDYVFGSLYSAATFIPFVIFCFVACASSARMLQQ